MSCSKANNSCHANSDCAPTSADESNCLSMLCNSSGKCAQSQCSSDSDCTQFGNNYKCVNGYCVNYSCDSETPCPSGMVCGTNGLCTSQNCTNGGCPMGAKCERLSDGTKICISRPGLQGPLMFLGFAIILLIIVSCIFYLIFTSNKYHNAISIH